MPKSTIAGSEIVPCRRGPADHRRQRAWNRADERRQRRARLQRRVHEDVADERGRRDRRRQWLHLPRPARSTPTAESSDAEPVLRRPPQPAARHRPSTRPAHQAVGLALPDLVERRGAARHERRADERVEQERQRDALRRREIHAAERRDQDQKIEARLGQRDEVRGAVRCARPRCARPTMTTAAGTLHARAPPIFWWLTASRDLCEPRPRRRGGSREQALRRSLGKP